jgi:hypothetical protein
MRLLKRERAGRFGLTTYRFSLTSFDRHNIPQYAILSHRWGADGEEVTFKDLKNGTGKGKAGYNKLNFCAERAARDRLEYFWIDTCCIDKTNNTELQEAINSMFKWYHGAKKCYVYLPDVSIHDDDMNQFARYKWESAFRKSTWFTRGWTLQELIAPKSVEFFSVEGVLLGDKNSLEQQIHETTDISLQALQEDCLSQFDFAERISWAAKRETTVEEDAVYCLLGIFDIHMPLIYGEGRKKAFIRLEKKFREALDSPTFPLKYESPMSVQLTLAEVFNGCLHAFDLFQVTQAKDTDLKRLLVRLNIERCRLYTWGEAMWLTKPPGSKNNVPLETATCRNLVKDTLDAMMQLLQDSEKIKHRYGCREIQNPSYQHKPTLGDDSDDPLVDLAASFSHFYVPTQSNSQQRGPQNKGIRKARWAVYDPKKFQNLIQDTKDLVDGLQNITESIFAAVRQGGMVRFGIQQIRNIDTLEIVSSACALDYPNISDAASTKSDVLTITTFPQEEILQWIAETDEAESGYIDQNGPKPFVYLNNSGDRKSGDLNSIVAKYLQKKGYTDTRAVLIAETWAKDTKVSSVANQIISDQNANL